MKMLAGILKTHKFEDLSDEFIREYYSRNNECPLRKDAEMILRKNQVPQSILTASKQSDIDGLVDQFGLRNLFYRNPWA